MNVKKKSIAVKTHYGHNNSLYLIMLTIKRKIPGDIIPLVCGVTGVHTNAGNFGKPWVVLGSSLELFRLVFLSGCGSSSMLNLFLLAVL